MNKPLISLITPVYNTNEAWLRICLESIINQDFSDWELCLCDNGSEPYPYILNILSEYSEEDSRVKVIRLGENEGGYKGLQAALDISLGKYVGLLDSDDFMPKFALKKIAQALTDFQPDVLYTDEMIMDREGSPVLPFYKPSYNRYLLCLLHYFGHLTLYRAPLIKRLGIRDCGGSYDYDLALRASEVTKEILHLPEILYYYRTYPESTSSITRQTCMDGGLKTLQDHLDFKYPGWVANQDGPIYKVTCDDGTLLHPLLDDTLSLIEGNHLLRTLFNI